MCVKLRCREIRKIKLFVSSFIGTSHVKSPISRVPKGLIHLNLSHCGLTSKGINNIAHALSLNKCMPNTLTHLYLSENNLKEDVTVSKLNFFFYSVQSNSRNSTKVNFFFSEFMQLLSSTKCDISSGFIQNRLLFRNGNVNRIQYIYI